MGRNMDKKAMMGGVVNAGLAGLAGGGAFMAASKVAPSIPWVRDHWYAAPAGLVVAGALVAGLGANAKKGRGAIQAIGQGIAGAGGALFAFAYQTKPADPSKPVQMTPSTQVTAMGYGDAGVMVDAPRWDRLLAPRARQAAGPGEAGVIVEEASGLFA
jgi:hypothetical protein